MPKATDEVAVSPATDTSAGVGTTRPGMRPTDRVDPKIALPHGHVLLAATLLGRLSDAVAQTQQTSGG